MAEYQPGDRVAEYNPGYMGAGRATITTVARLTATQVITATGNRYRRDGYAVGSGRGRLLPPDAPEVRTAAAAAALFRLRAHMDRLLKDAQPHNAADLIDKAEALVRAARAQITDPS
jgi:hypothetical protein